MKSNSLKRELLIALVIPALLIIAAVAFFADLVAQRALERALGDRLSAIAQSAITLTSPRVLTLERGDDDLRTSKNALSKLRTLREKTQVARLLLVRLSTAEVLADTKGELKIGDEYVRARFDAAELEIVKKGKNAVSVLFKGKDGRPYKTGYAPLQKRNGEIGGYVAVEAPVTYTDAIDELRLTMGGIALLGFAMLLIGAAWSARRVAVPLSNLSAAATKIGEGNLDAPIPTEGPIEAQVLGATMKSMSASLKARDEEMQMMLAGIAHEVRNPLGGIELFGGLLKEDLEGDKRQKYVMKILRELGVLTRVVNDFLDFARRRVHELQRANIHELVFEVLSTAEKDAQDRGVKLSSTVQKDLEADVDPEALKRAVLNLVRNGIQAAPKDTGEVKISSQLRDSDRFALLISDNGSGVPEDKREEVFAPFFTTKQKGTGLGLALVKKTVLAHEGSISVDQAELGGARFIVELPLDASTAKS